MARSSFQAARSSARVQRCDVLQLTLRRLDSILCTRSVNPKMLADAIKKIHAMCNYFTL